MDISKGLGRCDNYSCLENAEARCNDHKEKLCNGCAIGFHSTCSIYTSTEMDFIQRSKDSAELLVKEMTDCNSRYKIERIYPGFKEDLEIITAKVCRFVSNNKYINVTIYEADKVKEKCQNLIQRILESQAYANYIEFQSKLKISSQASTTYEDKLAEMNLNKISCSFLLDIRKEEEDFRENTLKAICKETMLDVDKFKRSNKRTKKKIEKVKEDIKEEIKKECSSLDKKIDQQINDLDKSYKNKMKAMEEKYESKIKKLNNTISLLNNRKKSSKKKQKSRNPSSSSKDIDEKSNVSSETIKRKSSTRNESKKITSEYRDKNKKPVKKPKTDEFKGRVVFKFLDTVSNNSKQKKRNIKTQPLSESDSEESPNAQKRFKRRKISENKSEERKSSSSRKRRSSSDDSSS